MKLRQPFFVRLVGILGALVIRCWLATVRVRYYGHSRKVLPTHNPPEKYIFAFWHESLLLPAFLIRDRGVKVLISKHSDGEIITQVVHRLGYETARGSTNRGGARALLEMFRSSRKSHLAITPDGPRGPRRRAHDGMAYLSAVSKLAVVPCAIGYRKCWRFQSWDRFAVPKPFSAASVFLGEPVPPPERRDPVSIEEHARLLQSRLDAVYLQADAWAELQHPPLAETEMVTAPRLSRAA